MIFCLGFGNGNELESQEEQDVQMDSERVDPIDFLLVQLYISQQMGIARERSTHPIPAFQSSLNEIKTFI